MHKYKVGDKASGLCLNHKCRKTHSGEVVSISVHGIVIKENGVLITLKREKEIKPDFLINKREGK